MMFGRKIAVRKEDASSSSSSHWSVLSIINDPIWSGDDLSLRLLSARRSSTSFLTSARESQVSAWSLIHRRILFDLKYTHSYQIVQIVVVAALTLYLSEKNRHILCWNTCSNPFCFFFLSVRRWIFSRVFQSNRIRSSFINWKKVQVVGEHFYHRSFFFNENDRSKLAHETETEGRKETINTHFLSPMRSSARRIDWTERIKRKSLCAIRLIQISFNDLFSTEKNS